MVQVTISYEEYQRLLNMEKTVISETVVFKILHALIVDNITSQASKTKGVESTTPQQITSEYVNSIIESIGYKIDINSNNVLTIFKV